jgi:hypothetical protein
METTELRFTVSETPLIALLLFSVFECTGLLFFQFVFELSYINNMTVFHCDNLYTNTLYLEQVQVLARLRLYLLSHISGHLCINLFVRQGLKLAWG